MSVWNSIRSDVRWHVAFFFIKEKAAVNVFPAKKASKFRDWLDCSTLELKPNNLAMEILSYLAYETVAQVRRSCPNVIFHVKSNQLSSEP